MDLFFNELSLKEAESPVMAKQWMLTLLSVYKFANTKGFKGLRLPRNIASTVLASNYTVANWLNDKTVDQVYRLLFMSQANYPFTEDILSKKNDEGRLLAEFHYRGKMSYGIGAAFMFDSLVISFDNDEEWNVISIPIRVIYYNEDDILQELEEHTKHCSKLCHVDLLKKWIQTLVRPSIPHGKILWLKRNEYFPHLTFCLAVESQISTLHENHPQFNQIKKRLFELEHYCRDWKSGSFDPRKLPSKVTPESETRLERLNDQLTISCMDGINRLFSWHFRYTPGAGRIYFCPEPETKRIHIGFIGLKLVD